MRHASCAKRLLGGAAGWGSHPDLMLHINMDEAESLSLIGRRPPSIVYWSEASNPGIDYLVTKCNHMTVTPWKHTCCQHF